VSYKWIQDAREDGRSFGGDMVRLGTVVGMFYLFGHLIGLPKDTALESGVLLGGADWFNRPKTYKTIRDVHERFRSTKNGETYERDETNRSN
jgi:hypothetical protein